MFRWIFSLYSPWQKQKFEVLKADESKGDAFHTIWVSTSPVQLLK